MLTKIKNFYAKRKGYYFFQIGFFVLLGLFAVTVWANYDYWVFKILIAQNYYCTNTLDEFYAMHIREENRRGFLRDFDRVVISSVTAQLTSINNDRYTYLYAPQEITASIDANRAAARRATIEAFDDETVYLFLPNISIATQRFVRENREELAQYSVLILDLRGNWGGFIPSFHRTADLFVPRGEILSRQDARLLSYTRASRGDAFFDFERIIILQNGRTASAAESLILAISEHVPEVITVGEQTFGKGVGQVTIPLTGGYALRATVLNVLGPDGRSINQVGIPPDVEFIFEQNTDLFEILSVFMHNNSISH
ncbi:MAG: S41 family peptidase [Defluviitaleaceae bacterium]|nr:S41 family peptidase [Defluviitaleaceae bacterium]